jgi:hypothetical protein
MPMGMAGRVIQIAPPGFLAWDACRKPAETSSISEAIQVTLWRIRP